MTFLTILLIYDLASIYLPSPNLFHIGLIASSAIYSLITIYYKLFVAPASPLNYTDNIFVQYWGHSYVSDYIVLSIPIVIHHLNNRHRVLSFSLLFLLGLALFFSNSRSSIVALIVGLSFLSPPHPTKKIVRNISLFCLGTALLYIFLFSNNLKSPNGSRPEYWTQAIQGFLASPLVGNGPGNFNILNRLYRHNLTSSSNYAHNSFLESLSANGIFFTSIVFIVIGLGLKHQFRNNRLYFVVGVTSLVNSLFDPSWSSPGILIITLIIIFDGINNKSKNNSYYLGLLTLIVFLFLISKVGSDIFFVNGKYDISLKFDPFNPNSLLQTIDKNASKIRFLYKNDPGFLYELSDINQLPQNETDFHRSIRLDHFGSTNQQVRIAFYYHSSQQWDKLADILTTIYSHISTIDIPFNQSMIIARTSYGLAIHEWDQKNLPSAIFHLQKAIDYSRHWSHFEIELASIYWHNQQPELAQKQLETCQQYSASAEHCSQYLHNLKTKGLPSPGYFSQTIYSLYPPLTESEIYQYQKQSP
jgi:hypothetical protein